MSSRSTHEPKFDSDTPKVDNDKPHLSSQLSMVSSKKTEAVTTHKSNSKVGTGNGATGNGNGNGNDRTETGNGMTQVIRQKLHFTDESLWKRFSARRLELIDTLSLSEKKASEQDESIKEVANKLRIEYKYSEDTLPDFEKLLRAGIQSVRRNRKRIPKSKLPGQTYHHYHYPRHRTSRSTLSSENGAEDSLPLPETSDSGTSPSLYKKKREHSKNETLTNHDWSNHDSEDDTMIDVVSPNFLSPSPSPFLHPPPPSSILPSFPSSSSSSSRIRISINSLVSPEPGSDSKLNSIRGNNIFESNNKTVHNPKTTSVNNNIGNNQKQFLTRYSSDDTNIPFDIFKLKTIESVVSLIDPYSISHRFHGPYYNMNCLESLGNSILETAAFHSLTQQTACISNPSKTIHNLLLSDSVLSGIAKHLPSINDQIKDHPTANNDLIPHFMVKIAICAHDKGFDPVISILSQLFFEILSKNSQLLDHEQNVTVTSQSLNEFKSSRTDTTICLREGQPIESQESSLFKNSSGYNNKNNNNNTNKRNTMDLDNNGNNGGNSLRGGTNRRFSNTSLSSSHVFSLPSPVASAPQSLCNAGIVSKPNVVPVTLRFFSQKLDFTYSPTTSTPPTVTEILENGRNAFHILSGSKVIKIRDINTGKVVETDMDLEDIYKCKRIDLELFFPSFEVPRSSKSSFTLPPISNLSTDSRISEANKNRFIDGKDSNPFNESLISHNRSSNNGNSKSGNSNKIALALPKFQELL